MGLVSQRRLGRPLNVSVPWTVSIEGHELCFERWPCPFAC
jgi:hypothetical protein